VLEKCVAGVITAVGQANWSNAKSTFHIVAVGDTIQVLDTDGSTVLVSTTDTTFNTATLHGQGLGGSDSYSSGSALDDFLLTTLVYDPLAPTLVSPVNNQYIDLAAGATFTGHYNNRNNADVPIARRARRKLGAGSYEYEQLDGTFGASETDIPLVDATSDVSVTYDPAVWTNDTYNWSWAFQGRDTNGWSPYANDIVVVGNAAPNLSITSPIGTVGDTNSPSIELGYDDPDSDPMTALQVKIFADDVATAVGFDPDISTAVWDSGVLTGSYDSVSLPIVLANNTTYWVYAKAYQVGSLDSGWVSSQFSIAVTPPATPVVVATFDPTTYGSTVTVQGQDNLASADLASNEGDVEAWTAVAGCTVVLSTDEAASGAKSTKITITADGDAVIVSEDIDVNGLDQLATAMAKVLAGANPKTVVLSAQCFDDQGNLLDTVSVASVVEQTGTSTPPPPPPPPPSDYELYFSVTSDRAEPALLDGETVAGSIYVQVLQTDQVTKVDFWLDAAMTTTPRRTESTPPFDFNGGVVIGGVDTAVAFDTTTVATGSHYISARITLQDGSQIDRTATFNVIRSTPGAPTGLTASSTVVGQVDTAWTAPASTGGSPITGYLVTATPTLGGAATTHDTADPAVLSYSFTGLTQGAIYDISVHAYNANGDGVESDPVSVSVMGTSGGGSTLYGPVGNEWPARTPTMQDPIDVTVNPDDWNALNNAIVSNRTLSRLVIAIADGTINPDSKTNLINAVTGLGDRAQNVLIRPLHVGGVKNNGLFRVNAGGITLAHMVGGAFYLAGDKNCAAVNNVLDKNSYSKVNLVVGYELVGNICKNAGGPSTSDRIQIIGKNGKIWRNWFEQKTADLTVTPHPHVDLMQILGHSGYLQILNEYHGGGGNNAGLFYQQSTQGSLSDTSEPSITLDTVYVAQSPQGSNDIMIVLYSGGMSLNMTRVVSQRHLRLRNAVANSSDLSFMTSLTATDCSGQDYDLLDNATGKHIEYNPTPGFTVVPAPGPTPPTFKPPTWWDHSWDTI
jgi:hypothetical protein